MAIEHALRASKTDTVALPAPSRKIVKSKAVDRITAQKARNAVTGSATRHEIKKPIATAEKKDVPAINKKEASILPPTPARTEIKTMPKTEISSPKIIKKVPTVSPALEKATVKLQDSVSNVIEKKTYEAEGVAQIVDDPSVQPILRSEVVETDDTAEDVAHVITDEFDPSIISQDAAMVQAADSETAPVIEEPNITFDVLSDDDIDAILSELPINAAPQSEVLATEETRSMPDGILTHETVELDEPTQNFVDIALLLDPLHASEPENSRSAEILHEMDIAPLPPVTIKVSEAIQELQITDPERADAAIEVLQKISFAIDEVIKLRQNKDEMAPNAEEDLQILCIELFSRLGWALEPETMMEFIQGVMQAKQMMQIFAEKEAVQNESGTREFKKEHDPLFGGILQESEDDLTRAIGTHAVRNYQFALA